MKFIIATIIDLCIVFIGGVIGTLFGDHSITYFYYGAIISAVTLIISDISTSIFMSVLAIQRETQHKIEEAAKMTKKTEDDSSKEDDEDTVELYNDYGDFMSGKRNEDEMEPYEEDTEDTVFLYNDYANYQ